MAAPKKVTFIQGDNFFCSTFDNKEVIFVCKEKKHQGQLQKITPPTKNILKNHHCHMK